MKAFPGSCIAGVVLSALATFTQAQSIFATVDGDTVTLWETQAYRNCGAMYTMEISQDDHTISWYQIDTGMTAVCGCVFDLAVTYGPLEPGDYSANVYMTDAWSPDDTIFEGSTSFNIGSAGREVTSGIVISQYQSDCYSGQGLEEGNEGGIFRIYPVPLKFGDLFYLETFTDSKNARLDIMNIAGNLIYRKQYDSNSPVKENWMVDELFPVAGIYVLKLTIGDKIFVRKIPVL